MNFQFDSLQDFLQMSGHGPYVWACYGITFVVLLYLVVQPIRRRRRFIHRQRLWLQKMAQEREVERQA